MTEHDEHNHEQIWGAMEGLFDCIFGIAAALEADRHGLEIGSLPTALRDTEDTARKLNTHMKRIEVIKDLREKLEAVDAEWRKNPPAKRWGAVHAEWRKAAG